MGTAVPLEAQEGNKYILTLIMKAFVAYALAAFAAIAANPIEATPYGYPMYGAPASDDPVAGPPPVAKRHANPYAYADAPEPLRTKRYAGGCGYFHAAPATYDPVAHQIGKRHANEPDVYDYDYGAAPYQQYRLTYKRGAYEENDYAAPALTKRAVVPAYEEIGHRLTYSSLP